MSQDLVLFNLLKSTLALLLGDETNVGENCGQMLTELDERIAQLRSSGISDDLRTSLTHLRTAVVSLRPCFENLKDGARSSAENSTNQNELPEAKSDLTEVSKAKKEVAISETDLLVHDKTKQPCNSQNSDVRLQKEVREMEASNDFKEAMDCFLESKKISAKVFEDDESERETKITATKVRVISEIFGNLANPNGAAEKCMEYISELNQIFSPKSLKSPFPFWYKALRYVNLQKLFASPERIGLDSAMHINIVVFRFIKEFTRKPVPMLDWPMIDIAREETYHPILGEQPSKTNTPDPFTSINHDKLWIDPKISTVNCSGEVFASGVPVKDERRSAPIGIMKISDHRRYDVDDKHKIEILSMSIDCADCETPSENVTEPTASKASAQSSEAQFGKTSCGFSFSLSNTPCKGKMYILASANESHRKYFLYVIDMEGNIQHKEELKSLDSKKLEQTKIFCMKKKKVIILDVTGYNIDIHIFYDKGKYLKTIDLIQHLPYAAHFKPTIFTISYNGEIVCSEEPSKLNVYNIDEEGSSLDKTHEVKLKHAVQAVAFNHNLDELIILCYTSVLFEYHLVTYTKSTRELKQDIKLQNGNYQAAELIFHKSGPVVLLDKDKLLHLK